MHKLAPSLMPVMLPGESLGRAQAIEALVCGLTAAWGSEPDGAGDTLTTREHLGRVELSKVIDLTRFTTRSE